MKHLKSCAATLLALLAADAAFADTIKITGSTAFRSATITSIQSLLTAGYDVAFSGATSTGAQYATYVGVYAGNPVTIQCSWTGSVEGVRDVSQGLTQNFIKAAYVTATAATSGAPTVTTDTAVYEAAIPDISLSDNSQSATIYTSPALKETSVAVIPFVFVKGRLGASHPASSAAILAANAAAPKNTAGQALASFDVITNITGNTAQALFSGGVPLSFLTGAADASGTQVYALGRNPLSGTRLVTFAETGYGAKSVAKQFKPVIDAIALSPTFGQITALDVYYNTVNGLNPIDPVTGDVYRDPVTNAPLAGTVDAGFSVDGNNGYSSGGTMAGELAKIVADTNGSGNVNDGVPFGLVGYVGVSDAATAEAAGATVLSYNGISIRSGGVWDFTAVKEGKYSLWSFEYLAYRKSAGPNSTTALSGQGLSFATALTTNLKANVPTTTAVKISDMKVQRAFEGATITK